MKSIRRQSRNIELLESRQLLAGTPQGNEFRVNTTTLLDQFAPAVARDYVGNFVVVWASEESEPTDFNVYGQRYDAAGVPQGGQFIVNTFTTGLQTRPAVAMDFDGDFFITWQSGTSDPGVFVGQDGSGWGIYGRKYNKAGSPLTSEFGINTTTTNDQDAPSIGMDNAGNFVVAYSSFENGVNWDVYARRYSSIGAPQGGEFRVNNTTADTQQDTSVAMANATGVFAVAFTSGSLAAAGTYDVYTRRYSATGVAQGNEFRVNTTTADFQTDASIAMDQDGDFVVTWNSFGQDGSDYGAYFQRYNAAGTVQGGEVRANTFTTGSQSDPRVDMNLFGDFTIVWGSTGQDGSGRGVYGQSFNANGTVDGTEFRVNTVTANNQTRPAIGLNANGDFVVAFQDGSTTPGVPGQDGSGYGIYARRYLQTDKLPPIVVSATFNFLTSQNLTIVFSENVQASLALADIQVFNQTLAQNIPQGNMALSYNPSTNTATITFPGYPFGAVPDGNYQVTLVATGITDTAGFQLDGNANGTGGDNYTFTFFFLQGDANHDGRANLTDYNAVAANFAQTGRDFSQGNFNYDTIVNLVDYNLLASRFGTILAPSASVNGRGPALQSPFATKPSRLPSLFDNDDDSIV